MAEEDVTDPTDKVDNSGTDAQDQSTDDKPNADAGKDAKDDKSGADTVLTSDDDGKASQHPADWPEDWRKKLAGDDEKLAKRLERMKSPKDVVQSWRALEQKMSSGEVKQTLPDDATEEQIAEYRKENGIPETSDGYLENLPDGLVIGEDDKEAVGSFLEAVHAKNASPDFVASALDWYYKTKEDEVAAQSDADKEVQKATEDALRSEWGNEYRGNINAITSFLDAAPTDEDGNSLKDLLMGARLADGTPLGNNAMALKWLLGIANDVNPAGFIAPGSAKTQAEGVDEEIAEIEKVMRTDRTRYDKDEKMQARYRQLLEAQEKLNTRAA